MKKLHYIASLIMLTVVLLSCESNFHDVQRFNSVAFNPIGESENINLKYTDSGRVSAILVSPLMKDYTQLENGYNEFPKGVDITLFDKGVQKTRVLADYGIRYENTDIIDLQGNVRVSTLDGKLLTTDQLYFDQKNEWFYTEKYFKFTDGRGSNLEGPGVDFSKDFKVFNMQQNQGIINNVQ
ncbi:LPS export ABC transporter periplasmic protein LptC [Flavobacterium sp. RHBU_24]|uniref:LPS export ABC transporter periplasmic protein LptC n=1 Tax=Flavobacterium sp. RHBU_24 TaxID=3391185 RepID=UPI0039855AA5